MTGNGFCPATQIEDGEKQGEAPRLIFGRTRGRSCVNAIPDQIASEFARGSMAQIGHRVAWDHGCERIIIPRAPQADAVAGRAIAQNEMPAARQQPIGKRARPARPIETSRTGKLRGRGVEDHDMRAEGGAPEGGRLGGGETGVERESSDPSAGS